MQGVPIKASCRESARSRLETFSDQFLYRLSDRRAGKRADLQRSRESCADARRFGQLQNAVVAKFPNVSALDLTSVIQTVDAILVKVALVIRIMSLFAVGTGLIVLGSTIWSGRYQRLKESVLLRTLGASRWQIWKILCAEYLFLGLLASATGIVLALAASWALAVFTFKLRLHAVAPADAAGGADCELVDSRGRLAHELRSRINATSRHPARGTGIIVGRALRLPIVLRPRVAQPGQATRLPYNLPARAVNSLFVRGRQLPRGNSPRRSWPMRVRTRRFTS